MIGRKTVLLISTRLFSAILAFLSLSIMTRYLGPETFGIITLLGSITVTVNTICDLGFRNAHIKRVSEGDDLNECLSTFASIRLMLTGLMVLANIVVIILWTTLLGKTLEPFAYQVFVLYIVYYVLMNLISIVTTTFEARTEVVKNQLVLMVELFVRVPAIIILLLVGFGAVEVVSAYVIGGLASLVLAYYYLAGLKIHWGRPVLRKKYIAFAMPLALMTAFNSISLNMDKILVGAYWSDSDVGFLTSGQILLSMLALAGGALATLAYPSFSKMVSEKKWDDIRKLTHDSERFLSLLLTPIILIMVVIPEAVAVFLLGDSFAGAADSIRFIALSVWIGSLCQISSMLILAANKPRISARIALWALILNIFLLFYLVPSDFFGIPCLGLSYVGAAIANVGYNLFVFFLTKKAASKLNNVKLDSRIWKHIAAAGLSGGLSYFALDLIELDTLGVISVGSALMLALYFSILAIWNEFRLSDVRYVLNVISPGKMKQYFKDELRK
jgi:O-antigen/teichoic acid export membrane protein